MTPLLDGLRGHLTVSVQSYPGEPLRHPETMAQFAEAVVAGGAAGIRAQGLADIAFIKGRVSVPLIGLWKDGEHGVFITPTLRQALAVVHAGADIVAIDGTRRPRPDGHTLTETITSLHTEVPDVPVMADCGSLDDARAAADAGADVLGTTLAGYTSDRHKTDGPDVELVEQIAAALPDTPVVAEGRIHTPAQARAVLDIGAHSAVVGTAITHPTTITEWFTQALG
jgi:N-acylglucosamine-6-phosphate 2-epimerase